MGTRIENLRSAVAGVLDLCEKKDVLTSSVFETAPVDCPEGSDPFYNAVIEVQCKLPAKEVLERCQQLELSLGRDDAEERETNAPRPIDIDLLYYGDKTLKGKKLALPHPRLLERRFVLEPLCEIRPGLTLPGQSASIEEVLDDLDSDEPALKQIYPSGMWL